MPATIPIIFGAIAAATSLAGTGYALSGAGQPGQPNLAASSAELANVEAMMLPIERQMSAAANLGQDVTINMPAHTQQVEQYYKPGGSQTVFNEMTGAKQTVQTPGQWITVQNGQSAPEGAKTRTSFQHVAAGPQTFNFSGMGAAEVQSQLQQQLAGVRLNLQQTYGPQFIQNELAQEQQAEPQQFAARQQEYNTLENQLNTPFVQPAANTLDTQVQQQLTAARNHTLDPMMTSALMGGGADAAGARGQAALSQAQLEQPLTTGQAGYQQQLAALQAGMGELQSGSNPQDIAYRHLQQNMANLGAFANSQTPEAEFGSLSGASNGAAPFNPGQSLPTMPNNSMGAQQAALGSWQTQLQAVESQMNPWMGGLSSALGIGNSLAAAQTQANNQTNFNALMAQLGMGAQG